MGLPPAMHRGMKEAMVGPITNRPVVTRATAIPDFLPVPPDRS